MKVLQIGLGPLGQKIVQFINKRTGIEIVGAADINPELRGEDVGEASNVPAMGVPVSGSIAEVLDSSDADCAILTTVSSFEKLAPQLRELITGGVSVVSTCEELLHPWNTHPELAAEIDEAAKSADVTVLGTGINPGFLMDSLPAFMTSVCQEVNSIKISRCQDASSRREPFQRKIGAGLNLATFEELIADKKIRHVGLTESIYLLSDSLGWKLDHVEDLVSPIFAEKSVASDLIQVPAGGVAGVQQIGKGFRNGEEKITLLFRAAIGEPNPADTIEISGNPNLKSTIDGGVNGDTATCAITINAVKQVIRAQPGLKTMTEIPLVSFFS